jgi:hypothetical protein
MADVDKDQSIILQDLAPYLPENKEKAGNRPDLLLLLNQFVWTNERGSFIFIMNRSVQSLL